jgi:uncharacterized protein YeaO (DUF488 family)
VTKGLKLLVKRVYEAPSSEDGARVLVDRLWPRGLSKKRARLDDWLKDVAPSDDLRHWFGHAAERWEEFEKRYAAELDAVPDAWRPLLDRARKETVTLLYGASDTEHNNAVALEHYLARRAAP